MTQHDKKGKRHDKITAGPSESAPKMNCAALSALLRLGESHGLDRDELLAACGLRSEALDDPDARFPYAVGLSLWAKVGEEAPNSAIGLEFATIVSAIERDLPRHVLAHCRDLRAAITTLIEIQSLVDTASPVFLASEGQNLRVGFSLPLGFEALHQPFEGLVAATFAILARLVGQAFAITHVAFQHPRRLDLEPYIRFFGREPEFGATATYFVIPQHVLDQAVLGASPDLGRHLAEHARHLVREEAQAAAAAQDDGASRWHDAVYKILNDPTTPTFALEAVARRLGLGMRTLQRRLLAEGRSFDAICDEVRERKARELLRNPALSLTEVALRLGYADRRSLARAIQRWMGQAAN